MLQNRNYSRKKFQSAGNINNEKKFIQDWFNHPETKKRLESNLKTFPHNKFSNADDFIKDINNNLNTVKTVYSENPKDTMDGLIKYYSEKNPTFNKETIEQLAINDFKERGGSYDEEAHTVLVNVPIKYNQAIAPHEYTHSTNTDKYFVNHLKNSTKFDEVNSNFEKLYGTGINYDTNKGLYSLKSKTTDPTLQKNIDELTRGFGNDIGTNFSVTAKLGKMGVDTKELGYINKSVEVYPRLMSIRRVGNLVPGQIVNKEMLAEIKAKMPQEKLFNYYSDEQIIEMLNTFADNNKVSYNNYAKYGGKFKRFQTAGEAGSLLYLTSPKKIAEYNKKQVEKPDLYNTNAKSDNTSYNNYQLTNQTKVTQTPITFAGKQPVYVNNKGMNNGATIKPAEPKTAYNTYFNTPSNEHGTGLIRTAANMINASDVVGAGMLTKGLVKKGLNKISKASQLKNSISYNKGKFSKFDESKLLNSVSNAVNDDVDLKIFQAIQEGEDYVRNWLSHPITMNKINKGNKEMLLENNKILDNHTFNATASSINKAMNKTIPVKTHDIYTKRDMSIDGVKDFLNHNTLVNGLYNPYTNKTYVSHSDYLDKAMNSDPEMLKYLKSISAHETAHSAQRNRFSYRHKNNMLQFPSGTLYSNNEEKLLQKPFDFKNDSYMGNNKEIHARVFQIRDALNLTPDDVFTEDMLPLALKESNGLSGFVKDKKAFVDMMNGIWSTAGVGVGTKLLQNNDNQIKYKQYKSKQ